LYRTWRRSLNESSWPLGAPLVPRSPLPSS